MAERTTAREVSVDLAGFKASTDKQFSHIIRWIVGLYAVIGAVIGGGFLLRDDLGNIKADTAKIGAEITSLRRDVTAIQERIGSLEKTLGVVEKTALDISTSQKSIALSQVEVINALGRLERKFPETNPLYVLALSPEEELVIREFFGVPKGPSKEPQYKVGQKISDALPLPREIVEKAPKLRGLRYLKDAASGSIVIVGFDNTVVAIISPV